MHTHARTHTHTFTHTHTRKGKNVAQAHNPQQAMLQGVPRARSHCELKPNPGQDRDTGAGQGGHSDRKLLCPRGYQRGETARTSDAAMATKIAGGGTGVCCCCCSRVEFAPPSATLLLSDAEVGVQGSSISLAKSKVIIIRSRCTLNQGSQCCTVALLSKLMQTESEPSWAGKRVRCSCVGPRVGPNLAVSFESAAYTSDRARTV